MKNYVEDYVDFILKSDVPIGRNQRLSIERHLKLKKNKKYYFDVDEANRIIEITNKLTIAKNGRVQKFKTRGFQDFILGSIVGWKVKETGKRLFREAYIQVGRQNGKSLLVSGLINYYSAFSKYNNSNIFCVATKLDQAKIVWKSVADFIKAMPILATKYYKIQEHIATITALKTNVKIKALGKDTKSLDGFDSILAICDEYHAHKDNQMYKLLFDGQIFVDNAITVAITTAGFDLNSPCYEFYKDCVNILEGIYDKDSQFIFICDPDKEDSIKDEKTWMKSNPFLLFNEDYTVNNLKIEDYRIKMKDAVRRQGKELVNFKTKQLNMWVDFREDDYLIKSSINKCASDKKIEDFKGRDCYIGLDLSSGGDLTSLSIIIPNEDNKVFIHSHSFIPENKVLEQEHQSKVPYRDWIRKGLLTITTTNGGIKTDYKYILQYLKRLIEENELNVLALGYDPYNANVFLEDLSEITDVLVSIQQSARNLSSTVEDFKLSMDSDLLEYDKRNELLKWSFGNARAVYNSFNEVKIEKGKRSEKIDPVISCIDAWYLYFNNKQEIDKINDDFDEWLSLMERR